MAVMAWRWEGVRLGGMMRIDESDTRIERLRIAFIASLSTRW